MKYAAYESNLLPLSNFRYWAEGEPNNMGGEEDCVENKFMGDPKRTWNDGTCNLLRLYICEKAM